jgi:hypothetical protein
MDKQSINYFIVKALPIVPVITLTRAILPVIRVDVEAVI